MNFPLQGSFIDPKKTIHPHFLIGREGWTTLRRNLLTPQTFELLYFLYSVYKLGITDLI